MKLNPNAVPFAFTPVEDSKRPRHYEMEQMLALKAQNVRVLPQMRKHEHSKYFLKFSYDLHYMLSLKAKNQQPPASLPSWFSMIYHSHYSPGKPLPEQPKSDDVRVADGRGRGVGDLRVDIPKPKWSLREAPVAKRSSPYKKHNHKEHESKSHKRTQSKKNDKSSAIPIHDLELHHSDNRWQAQPSSGEASAASKAITAILNKLSEENFDRLVKQTVAIPVSNFETLSVLAEHVFNKAIEEPHFAQLYARFCASLSELLPSFPDPRAPRTLDFRFTLLMLCHKYLVEQELDEEHLQNVAPEIKAEEEQKLWNRRKGNIILIGQLFTKQLLAKPVIHNCVEMLLKADEEEEEEGEGEETEAAPPSDTDVECVCILLRNIGPLLDLEEEKAVSRGKEQINRMDGYFERIQSLATHTSLPHRLRFMLRDLIELRQRHWDKPQPQSSPPNSPYGGKWRAAGKGSVRSPVAAANATRPKLSLHRPTHSRSGSASELGTATGAGGGGGERGGHESKRSVDMKGSPTPALERHSSTSSLPSTPRSQQRVLMLVKEYYSAQSVPEAVQCIHECHTSHPASPASKCAECESVFAEVVNQAVLQMLDGGEAALALCQTLLSELRSQNVVQPEHLIGGLGRVLRTLPDLALDIPQAPALMTRVCTHLLRNDISRAQLEAEMEGVNQECDGSPLPREVIARCFV